MKIAFLLQSFPCLSETFILNQITGLIDLGCDVRIVAFNKLKESKQHPDIQKYRLFDKTTYNKVPETKLAKRTKAAAQTIATFIQHPILVYRLQKTLLTKSQAYNYQKLFLGLRFIQENFDFIQCHYGPVGNQALFLKDIGLRVKISTVFHGYDLSVYMNEHGPNVYRELFTKGDVFLPISNFWKQKLLSLRCPEEKIVVNHMGIDTTFFRPVNRNKTHEGLNILTVARLTEKKGHRYALEAIQKVVKSIPHVEYHIAGDGPLLEELKEITCRLGIENYIIFHGKVNSSEIMELYNNADIFLLPSVTSSNGDMEGIPVSLMEAMACGLPVITSAHSGIPELVIDGKTGCIAPEKDSEAINKWIVHLAKSPELRNQLSNQGREYVNTFFNNKILCKQILKIIKLLLKDGGSRMKGYER
ncbi:MAG: glycosyltransferase [Phycisphaerae bacterium]|nr:glycosyltransferase [Phycisphaerae bacterium]